MSQLLLVYGTTTGNTETVALKIQQLLTQANHQVTVKNVTETSVEELKNYENFIFGSSTWDDGQLQADMKEFLAKLAGSGFKLVGKKVALFALGDSGYPAFCASAELLKTALITDGVNQVGEVLKVDGFPDMGENPQKITAWVTNLSANL